MKSGLRDRNNPAVEGTLLHEEETVSMKSGLRDRNNGFWPAKEGREVLSSQ